MLASCWSEKMSTCCSSWPPLWMDDCDMCWFWASRRPALPAWNMRRADEDTPRPFGGAPVGGGRGWRRAARLCASLRSCSEPPVGPPPMVVARLKGASRLDLAAGCTWSCGGGGRAESSDSWRRCMLRAGGSSKKSDTSRTLSSVSN